MGCGGPAAAVKRCRGGGAGKEEEDAGSPARSLPFPSPTTPAPFRCRTWPCQSKGDTVCPVARSSVTAQRMGSDSASLISLEAIIVCEHRKSIARGSGCPSPPGRAARHSAGGRSLCWARHHLVGVAIDEGAWPRRGRGQRARGAGRRCRAAQRWRRRSWSGCGWRGPAWPSPCSPAAATRKVRPRGAAQGGGRHHPALLPGGEGAADPESSLPRGPVGTRCRDAGTSGRGA